MKKYPNSYGNNRGYKANMGTPFFIELAGRKWTPERYEMLLHKLAALKLSPKLITDTEAAGILKISISTVKKLRRDPTYVKIKNSMLQEVREQWKGEIQAMLLSKAIKGDLKATEMFYNLEKEFDNMNSGRQNDIPSDPDERKAMIDKLAAEVGYLKPNDSPLSAPVPTDSNVDNT